MPQLISRLEGGEDVAVVTDAGTPGVSDPGLELVQAAIDRDITVDPIPGASAPLAALIASGFPLVPFTVFGFAPSRSKDRKRWLENIGKTPNTLSFFEAPHRIQATLEEAANILGERQIMAARELTKVHQEFLRGTASQLAPLVSSRKGEFTIIVGPAINAGESNDLQFSDDDVVREFWRLTEYGEGSRRQTISEVAKRCGRSPKQVYSVVERAKKLGI